MIDKFSILERGGTVLWAKDFIALKGSPLDRFMRSILLEERTSQQSLSYDSYTLEWALSNDLNLVYIVVFQRMLPPSYSQHLLSLVKDAFVKKYAESIKSEDLDSIEFDEFTSIFDKLHIKAEDEAIQKNAPFRQMNSKKISSKREGGKREKDAEVTVVKKSSDANETPPEQNGDKMSSPEQNIMKNRAAFAARMRRKKKPTASSAKSGETPPAKPGKIMRPSKKSQKEEETVLDFSNETSKTLNRENSENDAQLSRFREQFVDAKPSQYDLLDESDEDGDEDASEEFSKEEDANEKQRKKNTNTVMGFFKGLVGRKNLERSDMEAALSKFRDVLIAKNVAQHIAASLVDSAAANLEGKKMESWRRVTTTVKNALNDSLTRILTPRQGTDVLAEINAHQGSGSSRPYVIVFCGVNGVGKSTSLAKICYYLINHGKRVMIAAGDTFRAGAVEQLRTHVKCLGRGVELYDKGYGKDAAAVAMEAIRKAQNEKFDVVLVDTAGRMQDNEPLMRALAKLVEINRPDRIFFVGEALVGNDAVDQLSKFNAALTDYQSGAQPRLIDGIVLTKFDTIDDKVGAAVSMVYTTGQPIVFVGVGQTYMDLRKCNTQALVRALLR